MHCASSQKQKHTKTVPHLVPKHTTHEDTGNDCLYCCQAMSKHGCLIFFVPFHGKLRTVRLETDAKAYLKTFSAHHFWLELNIDFLFNMCNVLKQAHLRPNVLGDCTESPLRTPKTSLPFSMPIRKTLLPHFFCAFPKKASNCTTSNWRQGLTQNIFCTSLLIRIYYTFPVQHVQPPLELLQPTHTIQYSTILQTKLTIYFLFTMCNVLSDCTESPLGTPKTSLASSMISLPALMFLFCKWIVRISNLTILVMRFWSIRLDLAPLARHPAQAHTNWKARSRHPEQVH